MALATNRALNIQCKIGKLDISNKSIDSFEVERNCSDTANKFSMTLIDTPDTEITYDLEMYMAGGYRDIDITYGDLEDNSFTRMKGTIYNYSYNYVGNIKSLTISGLCSTFINSGVVGSLNYNIDWNSYVNQRWDEQRPWNIVELQNAAYNIQSQHFTIQGNESIDGSKLINSYILNEKYKKAVDYNSKTQLIRSPKTGNTIEIPIPELFISCKCPFEYLSTADYEPYSGRITNDSYIDNYKDPTAGFPDYYLYCKDNKDLWGDLIPYAYKNANWTKYLTTERYIPTKAMSEGYIKSVKDIVFYHGEFTGTTVRVPANTLVGYRGIQGDASILNVDHVQIKDDFGQDVWFRLDSNNSKTYYWSLDYNSAGFSYLSVTSNSSILPEAKVSNAHDYYSLLRDYDEYWGKLTATSINGKTYILKDDNQIISLDGSQVSGKTERWIPSDEELAEAFIDIGTIKSNYRRNNFIKQEQNIVKKKSSDRIFLIAVKSTDLGDVTDVKVSQIVWLDRQMNFRAFSHPEDPTTMYIQVAPGSNYYSQGSFVSSGAGVDPSHIVSELAKLEGWNTQNDKYITQTATLKYSENYIMNNSSAIDFITEKLIPNSVTAAGIYQNKKGEKVYLTQAKAGYSIWFDKHDVLHYHPISTDNTETLKLEMGYNYPNSPVLTFSVNTKGTAFYTQATKQISTLSIVTGKPISTISGLTSADAYAVAESSIHNTFLDNWYGTTYQEVEDKGFTSVRQVEDFYDALVSKTYVSSIVKSGTQSETEVKANMNQVLEYIKDFTITGTMSIVGNSKIKPFKNLTIINMVKGAGFTKFSTNKNQGGYNYASGEPVIHPSSGIYLIISQTDKFSASAGFVQELNLIRQTNDLQALLDDEIDYGIKAVFWYDGPIAPTYVGTFTFSANDQNN